jgi:hypothetical protein
MKKFLFLIAVTLIFAACKNNNSENALGTKVFQSSLDEQSYMNMQTFSKEVAHSGKISSKIDSLNPYSFGFNNSFASISDTIPVRVDVSFWAYTTKPGINANLVFTIDSVNKGLYWEGVKLHDSIKVANQWKEIKASFKIPKKVLPTDIVKIYVWSMDPAKCYIDDMKFVFHTVAPEPK